jgi:hypothetical protein
LQEGIRLLLLSIIIVAVAVAVAVAVNSALYSSENLITTLPFYSNHNISKPRSLNIRTTQFHHRRALESSMAQRTTKPAPLTVVPVLLVIAYGGDVCDVFDFCVVERNLRGGRRGFYMYCLSNLGLGLWSGVNELGVFIH